MPCDVGGWLVRLAAILNQDGVRQFGGHLLQARGRGDRVPERQMGPTPGKTKRAYDGNAGFKPDTELKRGEVLWRRCGKRLAAGFEHEPCGLQGALAIERVRPAAPNGEHGIALQRLDDTAMLFDDTGSHGEEGMQDAGGFFGRTGFAM